MNDKRNASLRDALLKAVAIAAFTAVPATAFAPVASATVYLDDVNDGNCDLGNGDDTGDGSASDPYRISTVEDLAEVTDCNYDDTYYYELTNDLDLTPNGNYNNDGFDWNGLDYGWVPIGAATVYDFDIDGDPYYTTDDFNGFFDGNGYTIRNLEIDNSEAENDYIGLFSYTDGANISNLTIEGSIDAGDYDDYTDYVGMFSGWDQDSNYTNVHAVVDIVDADDYVGGLIGNTEGTRISRSSTSGTIEGLEDESYRMGGLVGYAENDDQPTTLTNVSSSVSVNDIEDGEANDSDFDRVGGLIGDADDAIINHATFSGTVFGNYDVGGLVGYMNGTFINDAHVLASAIIASDSDDDVDEVGGLVGQFDYGTMNNVSFAGTLDAVQDDYDTEYIGGLVGSTYYANIVNGVVTEDAQLSITGNGDDSYDIGGLVGYADETSITSSANYADFDVTDANYVGGLVGVLDNSQVSASLNRGNVTVSLDDISFDEDMGSVGGIVGYINWDSEVSNSTNKGDITLQGDEDTYGVGGIVGYSEYGQVSILDNYNTGDITGVWDVAGIVGYVENDWTQIERNYSVGLLTAYDDTADGIANVSGDIYEPSNAVLLSDNADNDVDALELTAAELKSGADLVDAGWLINLEDGDIVDGADWATSSAFNSGYPSLVWETVSEEINEPIGLEDVEFANAVQFTGAKRFLLTLAERNYLNSVAAVINEHEFGSVVIDVYYGNKPRLAEKRAKQVKRYLVRRFVGTTISWNVYQADGQNGVGTVNIAALVD